MHWKHKIPSLVVVLTNSGFAGLLAYLTWLASNKYIDQPIATYVSYTNGDDNVNIEFPNLIFCNESNFNLSQTIFEQIKRNSSFDVQKAIESRTPNISDLFVWGLMYGYEPEGHYSVQDFYQIYDFYYGPCIGVELGNWQITDDAATATFLVLMLNLTGPMRLFFHSSYDAPDARDINSFVKLEHTGRFPLISLRKKITKSDTTNAIPCGDFEKKTCRSVHGTSKVAKQFNCKIPFVYSGKHLKKYVSGYNELPACNQTVVKESWKLLWNMPDDCKRAKACMSTKYDIIEKPRFEVGNITTRKVVLTFTTFEVEHFTTYISYDGLSLMAELGGLLGMTLGLSFASVGDVVANVIRRHILKIE